MIIGCGNLDRGDDAAGILAARRLRELGVLDVVEHPGDGLALIEVWAGEETVILIDAVVSGAEPGQLHFWDGRNAPLALPTATSSHSFGVAEAVRLAHTLGRLPAHLWIYGIEARQFALGSEPSAEVVRAVAEVVARIRG